MTKYVSLKDSKVQGCWFDSPVISGTYLHPYSHMRTKTNGEAIVAKLFLDWLFVVFLVCLISTISSVQGAASLFKPISFMVFWGHTITIALYLGRVEIESTDKRKT